jgi:NAD-dependent deacetylase
MISADLQRSIDKARAILSKARHGVAFTGAGISTPSGIPDFRSAGTGMWEKYSPMETASLTAFRTDPTRYWNWKRPLMLGSWNAQPNPAHYALAQLESLGLLKAVITQNIDGLHQRAGSKNVLEVHGTIDSMTCPACSQQYPSLEFRSVLEQPAGIPKCPRDGTILKPDVVLFEESLPMQTWKLAEEHADAADVMLIVGSSLEVYPAGYLPGVAAGHGAKVIIANLSSTYMDGDAQVLLPADVAETLPALVEGLA